jgi:palmitoyltransferase
MAGFNDAPFIRGLAVPSVCTLITFLGYFSQIVFSFSTLDPGPPSRSETILFNGLLLVLWITYYRAVTVDPGRYVFKDRVIDADGQRWCNKCSAPKPPRSHHCRHCARCVPKMDHHCPWTRNCVSMTTFPHFLRFLIYTNLSLWMLAYLLWQRFAVLWEQRLMPAYLGPSLSGLISLSLITLIDFFTTVALGIMLINTVRAWIFNQTMIEGWEQERHEAHIDRGVKDWWDVTGPDGEKVRFEKLEFPYDIGFFANMSQAMGTRNVLWWFWPLAGNPVIAKDGRGSGWTWEENGFNRVEGLWPPPDPDKIRRAGRGWPAANRNYAEELRQANLNPEEFKAEFQRRQDEDARRRRRQLMAELEEVDDFDMYDDEEYDRGFDGGLGWTNSDGDRLRDYGVDEEESEPEPGFEDEDVPLAELIRRRKVLQKDSYDD